MNRRDDDLQATLENEPMCQGLEDLTVRIRREVPRLSPRQLPVRPDSGPGDYARAAKDLHTVEVSLESLWGSE